MPEQFDQLQTDQDVEEILRRAVGKGESSALLRERLERSAAELGISPEALAEAEAEFHRERHVEAQEKVARSRRRQKFVEHFASYVSVNLMLIGIWFFSGRDSSFWPIWPIIGWGLFGVLPHFVNAMILNKDEEDEEGER